jgi:perosamine synthetase
VIRKFEKAFTEYFSGIESFSFWKARVALFALLKSMNIRKHDEVIILGYTCVMNINPIKYLGAVPIYIDIDPHSFNLNPTLLEEHITNRTRLIIAQHTYGFPCEMEPILKIAEKHRIPVIEDCCLAHGSRYKGKLCGTMGIASYFSFQWNKPLTTGLGGMAITHDSTLTKEMHRFVGREMQSPSRKASSLLYAQRFLYEILNYPRTNALLTKLYRQLVKSNILLGSSDQKEFRPEMAENFITGMSINQARTGLRKMKQISINIAHRKKMKGIYDKLLSDAGFVIPSLPDYIEPSLVRYPIRISNKETALSEAPSAGIKLGSWFESPLHPRETSLSLYNYEMGSCPLAEKATIETVNLPLHLRANEKTAIRTTRFLEKFGSPPN